MTNGIIQKTCKAAINRLETIKQEHDIMQNEYNHGIWVAYDNAISEIKLKIEQELIEKIKHVLETDGIGGQLHGELQKKILGDNQE